MFFNVLFLILYLCALAAAQTPSIVCIAGQCIQGVSNTTIGVTLTKDNVKLLVLPGQYTSTTNPQLLHDALTSSSSSMTPSPGFEKSSASRSLPMSLELEPGVAVYEQKMYSGAASFIELPTALSNVNQSGGVPLPPNNAMALATNIWALFRTTSNDRVVLWDSAPDMAQLPLSSSNSSSSLSLIEMQSTKCSTPCSSSSICAPDGKCVCPPNFTGNACEQCATGFFGPTCQPCDSGCKKCDEGITGTGRCLEIDNPTALETCNCQNGQCNPSGGCDCNPGWTTADSGVSCSKCSSGFFKDSTDNCRVCSLGCTSCSDGQGFCTSCIAGFTLDASRGTCSPANVKCPDGFFGDGDNCQPCDGSCETCATSATQCVKCASGSFMLEGKCVKADQDGICEGSAMIADTVKRQCNTCDAKCTTCTIPSFDLSVIFDKRQCTRCVAGFVLSEGKCLEQCPSGTFLDGGECKACDSSCGGSCSGSPTFCLTCPNNQLVSNGTCVTTCPPKTFLAPQTKTCVPCHPDCETCSGSGFNQCLTCPSISPVKSSDGRCLKTCSRTQYFDSTSGGGCKDCDPSCSSCSGPGPSKCLACSSPANFLRGGACVAANCANGESVLPGLGVCLSNLVASTTSSPTPLPSVTGIADPITAPAKRTLEWWQILLMALGCAFIFMVFLMCWRRRARKQRAQRTVEWAQQRQLGVGKSSWKWKFLRAGEKLFGHRASKRAYPQAPLQDDMSLKRLRLADLEAARHEHDMDMLIGSYADRSVKSSKASSKPSSSYHSSRHQQTRGLQHSNSVMSSSSSSHQSQLSGPSLYSQVTGNTRRTPDVKQPVKELPNGSGSRLSASTYASSFFKDSALKGPTDAEAYKQAVRAEEPPSLSTVWLQPHPTGGSSRNPFRV